MGSSELPLPEGGDPGACHRGQGRYAVGAGDRNATASTPDSVDHGRRGYDSAVLAWFLGYDPG
jgi:hypothetical protein